MMSDNNEGMVSVDDAAKLLSVSKSTIYAWIKNPEMQERFPTPVSIPNSKKIAIPKKELSDYLAWLLDQRRIAPVVHRTDRNNKTPVSMTREDKQALERARRGLPADYSFSSEEETV